MRDKEKGNRTWGNLGSFYFNDYFSCLHFQEEKAENTSLLKNVKIIPPFWKVDVYENFLAFLIRENGYIEGDIRAPAKKASLFPFDFKWTEDIAATARELAQSIERVLEATGHDQVDIIGHSYGGTLARYCSIIGEKDIMEHRTGISSLGKKIARVFMIGTANRGALDNFRVLHQGFRFAPLGKHFGPLYAFSLKSAFFTLPDPGAPLFVERGSYRDLEIDLFAAENWSSYGWSIFHQEMVQFVSKLMKNRCGKDYRRKLDEFYATQEDFLKSILLRSRTFITILSSTDIREEWPEYFVLGGNAFPTLHRAFLYPEGDRWATRFPNGKKAPLFPPLFRPGDGDTSLVTLTALKGLTPERVYCFDSAHRILLRDKKLLTRLAELLKGFEP